MIFGSKPRTICVLTMENHYWGMAHFGIFTLERAASAAASRRGSSTKLGTFGRGRERRFR